MKIKYVFLMTLIFASFLFGGRKKKNEKQEEVDGISFVKQQRTKLNIFRNKIRLVDSLTPTHTISRIVKNLEKIGNENDQRIIHLLKQCDAVKREIIKREIIRDANILLMTRNSNNQPNTTVAL